jgi:hypothetical protein
MLLNAHLNGVDLILHHDLNVGRHGLDHLEAVHLDDGGALCVETLKRKNSTLLTLPKEAEQDDGGKNIEFSGKNRETLSQIL